MIPSILQPIRCQRPSDISRGRVGKNPDRHFKKFALPLPEPIDGAQWQAGVTADNERYRILLDGLPCPLAFAASVKDGWVMCYEEREDLRLSEGSHTEHTSSQYLAAQRRLNGKVRIVRGE